MWSSNVIIEIIKELSAVTIDSLEIKANFEIFIKKMKVAVYADSYLFYKGNSFFPRSKGHLGCVECNPADLPFVKPAVIETMLIQKNLKKSTLYKFGSKKSIKVDKFIFGHLLADYCFQLIMHYLRKRFNLQGLSKDIINRMAINKFFGFEFTSSVIYSYHNKQLDRITP